MNIEFIHIDHIQLSITPGQVEQARHFYCGILGLHEIARPSALDSIEGFWAVMGDTRLHIAAEEHVCPTRRHPAFEVRDIEQVKAYLAAADVRIQDDQALPGLSRFSFFDPWGNRIELMEQNI